MTAVYGFAETLLRAAALARHLDLPCHEVELHRFPDGESRVRVVPPARRALLYRSLDRPNDKLVELLLAAAALRDQGCEELWLIAPYLCYLRQDTAFRPGEAVSQRVVGELLGSRFDALVTVDLHLHRVASLAPVVAPATAISLSAAPLFAELLAGEGVDPAALLLAGPDAESRQWLAAVATPLGLSSVVAAKRRRGDRRVELAFDAAAPITGRRVVLVDDVCATGGTLAAAARSLRAAGAASVEVLVTHALLDAAAAATLAEAGVERLRSSDSVPHDSNAVALAGLLAAAVGERL